jgi:hypothetical protein
VTEPPGIQSESKSALFRVEDYVIRLRKLWHHEEDVRLCEQLKIQMADVDMADAGGVAVQLPATPLQKHNFFAPPQPTTLIEADLYSKLKTLQRDLEFLSLQEVHLPETV